MQEIVKQIAAQQKRSDANGKKQKLGDDTDGGVYAREKFLRYGDYFLLRGSEKPFKYLSSRSVLEESVYFLQQNVKLECADYDILDYPGFSELLFAIYPNHYYEASKAYDKFQAKEMQSSSYSKIPNPIDSTVSGHRGDSDFVLPSKEVSKFDTLRHRTEAEIEINNRRVEEFQGQFVTIGAEIMLYHVYSGAFIKATREKNDSDKHQNLFHVKLSQTPSSSTHFVVRINPYLNFKKEGEKIAYDELIYFENTKYHSVFSIPNDPAILIQPAATTPSSSAHYTRQTPPMLPIDSAPTEADEANVMAYSSKNELNYVPTLEQMPYYQQSLSGHRKALKERIDTFQAVFVKKINSKLVGANGSTVSTTVMTNNRTAAVRSNLTKDKKAVEILWGDYVQLKHVMRSNKKVSTIQLESNVCGQYPQALAVVKDEANANDKDSCCNVFQIVPNNESDLGEPITFDHADYGSSTIRLRHILTGKYLQISQGSMNLSKTCDEEIMEGRKKVVQQRRKKKKNQEVKTVLPPLQSKISVPLEEIKEIEKNKSESVMSNSSAPQLVGNASISAFAGMNSSASPADNADTNPNNGLRVLDDHVQAYRDSTKLVIMSAARDEKYLRTTTAFQLRSENNIYARVNESDIPEQFGSMDREKSQEIKRRKTTESKRKKSKYQENGPDDYASLPTDLCNEEYFNPWFMTMDSLKRKYYTILSDEIEGDFFYLDVVPEQILSEFNAINCLLHPIILLCESAPKNIFTNSTIQQALHNLTTLSLWLCNANYDTSAASVRISATDAQKTEATTTMPILRRQALLREVGLIDILIKIIMHLFRNQNLCMDFVERNMDIFEFTQCAIEMLMKVSEKNYANSMYVISWYSLFKLIILDKEVVMEFKFDRLVNQLFRETNINVSFQGDLRQIANEIRYEDINLNALNLLLSFCQYNPFRNKHEHEEITQFLLHNEQIRNNIFRPFQLHEDGKVYIKMEEGLDESLQKTVINKDFAQSQRNMYLYSIQVVNLTTELCKGGPALIIDYIQQYYDSKVVFAIIKNEEIPPAYRATFLHLFKESYLVNDFKYTIVTEFPSFIKVKRPQARDSSMLREMFVKFRESISKKYFHVSDPNEIRDFSQSYAAKASTNINLKEIINQFLSNFSTTTYNELSSTREAASEVNSLANSILSLCDFIVMRGFYTTDEKEHLEKMLYEIMQQAYAFRKIKAHNKGYMKERNIGGVMVTKNIHIPAEMNSWFLIVLKILSFLEDLRLDELLQNLFKSPELSHYFGKPKDSKQSVIKKEKMSSSMIMGSDEQQIYYIKEKRSKLQDFLEREQVDWNIKNVFILSELLLLDNLELKSRIVDLIYRQFSCGKRYLETFNATVTIDETNETNYLTLDEVFFVIHFSLTDLLFAKSTEIDVNLMNLSKMVEAFKDLITFLFDENPPDDLVELDTFDLFDADVVANQVKPSIQTHGRTNFITFQDNSDHASRKQVENQGSPHSLKQVEYEKFLPSNRIDGMKDELAIDNIDHDIEIEESSEEHEKLEVLAVASNPYLIQKNLSSNTPGPIEKLQNEQLQGSPKKQGQSEQNSKRISQEGKVMYSILDQHYIDIGSLFDNQRLLKNMGFEKQVIQVLLIFGEKNFDKETGEFTKQRSAIMRDSLMSLIYFTLQNEENQEIILQHPQYPEIIKSIFALKHADGMMELTFIFLAQIYKDNYSILLSLGNHFQKQGNFVLKRLFTTFFEQASKQDKTFCIYFFQFLKYFFTINGKNIQQNQTLLLKIFQDDSFTSKQQIQSVITAAIQTTCYDYQNPMENRLDFDKDDAFMIRIPQESILLQQMLRTFRELAKGSGLGVNTFVRVFFSLQDLKTIIQNATWNPSLQSEAVDFLVEVYLNSKNIEPNEHREIEIIITEILYKRIQDYQDFTKPTTKNQHNTKWKCKADSLNIFEGKNPFGTLRYLIQMNYLYGVEYYILNSIVPCIQSFLNKLPESLTDSQCDLINKIQELCKSLNTYWDNEEEQWKDMYEGRFQQDQLPIESKNELNNTNNYLHAGSMHYSKSGLEGINRASTRKMYSKNVQGTSLQRNQKKSDMLKITVVMLGNLLQTKKYRDISMRQGNILTNYNYEAAFALARQNRPSPLFGKTHIENEQAKDMDVLISTLIEIKEHDQPKFRAIVQSFITVLSSETIEMDTRMNSMKILRKLSNYKHNSSVNESIQHDLIAMGFLNFLCDVITVEQDALMKLEYIRGLIDFMDEGNREIQQSFYRYLLADTDNRFLLEINHFLQQNYHASKSNQILLEDKSYHHQHFRRILLLKQEICIKTLELLRLSAENHFAPMQHFLREQRNENGERKKNTVNMIQELADMFDRHKKTMQDNDLQLGGKILDTLIEWIQGPCEENQLALCNTSLLENLEDMQYDINKHSKKRGEYQKYRSEFNQKTILLLRSLFEGNYNSLITKKVSMYVDSSLMIDTISENYKQYLEYSKKVSNIHSCLQQAVQQSLARQDGSASLYGQPEGSSSPEEEVVVKVLPQESFRHSQTSQMFSETSTLLSMSASSKKTRSVTNVQQSNVGGNISGGINSSNASSSSSSANESADFYNKANQVISEGNQPFIHLRAFELFNADAVCCMYPPIAFERYMLLKSLSYLDKMFRRKYLDSIDSLLNKQSTNVSEDVRKALIFMEQNLGSVEIVDSRERVQKVYFRIPAISQYLSRMSKNKFLAKVNRDGSSEKLTGLLGAESNLMDEILHLLRLNALGMYVNLAYLSYARNLNLTIAFIINIFQLIDIFSSSDAGSIVASVFQYINLGISAVVLGFWMVFEMPLEFKLIMARYQKFKKKSSSSRGRAVQSKVAIVHCCRVMAAEMKYYGVRAVFFATQILVESHLVYLLVYFFFSLGGILWNDLFFSLLLLDIIERSEVLQNVIKAVTKNAIQLIMTSILGVVLVYIYAMVGYYSDTLKNSFLFYGPGYDVNDPICTHASDCFAVFLNLGLRSGGGIADVLYSPSEKDPTNEYMERFFFDLSFKIIVIIIMLNILFGIIIDTFGELRDERQFKEEDERNRCFICNLERNEFESERLNFGKHIAKEHSIWNYFFFITHLRYKNPSELDGIESYVLSKIEKQDQSWFPVGRALKLEQIRNEDPDDDIDMNDEKSNLF